MANCHDFQQTTDTKSFRNMKNVYLKKQKTMHFSQIAKALTSILVYSFLIQRLMPTEGELSEVDANDNFFNIFEL
jgi:hypothetical protein